MHGEKQVFRSEANQYQVEFNSFKKSQSFQPPLSLPRGAGEKKREGLSDLNDLNVLNRGGLFFSLASRPVAIEASIAEAGLIVLTLVS